MNAPDRTLVVAAAVVEREGRFLITRRLHGTHLEGCWEFPGGKCEPGETLEACLIREIDEELGAPATVGAELLHVHHDYPDRQVDLHFFACRLEQDPHPRLGQEMRWISRDDFDALPFPPADAALIRMLRG
ncbi:MAG TPA: (deoxy)nucleoside triphosphate pyrophosphohydrolase [Vicinamibacterales bacterium]|nr:(deoxy)nucleoside triphosphate pyrophosphohydrolase [Vicinamibacterales bacterium]